MKIERAQKKKQKLKIALAGISGSGKTYSALTLAFSMCQKICVIDTECGSASLYSDHFPEYDVLELNAPYSPQRYIEAITAVEKAGYECIIIDSLSHEWNGAGGCLDMVNAVSKAGGNSYTAWGKVTPHHDALINRMISAQTHIIVTMRTKTAYEMGVNEKGKQAPVKVGMAPTQRDGVEYEFTIVFDIDQNHNFTCSKDRTAMFNNVDIPQPLNDTVGKKILNWLDSGVEPVRSFSLIPAASEPSPMPELPESKPASAYMSLPEGVTEEDAKEIRAGFILLASKIRSKIEFAQGYPADPNVDPEDQRTAYDKHMGEIEKQCIQEWYSICNRYMLQNDWFVVPQNWAEGMHALLRLKKPLSIQKGVVDFGHGDVLYLDKVLEDKQVVNE